LHSILGYSGLIQSDNSSAVDKRRIEAVQRSGRHLLELIDELLDYARIDAGRLKIELRPTFVSSFLESVVEETSELARSCGAELSTDIAPALTAVAMLDPVRLRQVLINLIANACRHSQGSRVTLEVGERCKRDGSLTLCIGVRDNGVGITPQDQARIFKPFEQGAVLSDRHGMGLGLAISWQLVQLMGGQLLYEAPVEGGSLFHFCIDIDKAEEAQVVSPLHGRSSVRRYAGPVHRILIVDDMADNRALLADVLASFGFDLVVAAGGDEALSLLAKESFGLVVTDQLMPDMSGWQFLRAAREAGHVMPFVLLSAALPVLPDGWQPHHVFAAILMKPVEPDRLADVLADALDLQWEDDSLLDDAKASPPLQRPSAEMLLPLREAAEQGRITDIEDWVDRMLATEPDSHDFALAVRHSVRRLDLAGILGLIGP
jgi:CheY-like chemotaxis protein